LKRAPEQLRQQVLVPFGTKSKSCLVFERRMNWAYTTLASLLTGQQPAENRLTPSKKIKPCRKPDTPDGARAIKQVLKL
jgi:hypothetical protein